MCLYKPLDLSREPTVADLFLVCVYTATKNNQRSAEEICNIVKIEPLSFVSHTLNGARRQEIYERVRHY